MAKKKKFPSKQKVTPRRETKRNPLAVLYSLIALLFIFLMYMYYWMFVAPAALFSWLGWRELFKRN